MKGLQSTHLPVVDLLRCPLEDQALGKNTSDSCSSHEATQPPLWKDPLACMTFLGHNNTGFLYGMQQNKAWQVISISYFALVRFAIKTPRSYTFIRKGPRLPRLTVDCRVPTIIKDYDCSSLLNGKRPAKKRETKIWLIIVHSVNNFARSELPAWKSNMAGKEVGTRRKKWQKLRTVLYNSTNALMLISTVRVWQNRNLNSIL